MKKSILIVIGIFVGIFVLIQFIPLNMTNPTPTQEIKWDSPQTKELAQRACFDCHSDETAWPWYSRIAPASILLAHHVNEGRSRLNFSEWDKPNAEFDEVQRNIERGSMPTRDYLLIHPTANLTASEKQALISGLQATFQNDPPIARPRGRRFD